jgi:hypothetical protein
MRSPRSALLLVGSVAGAATWIDCGRLQRLQTADSILPALVSIQHWTPFFWGEDRFGMLVPLLAMPIRNPFYNLLAQGWITIASALLAPFLAARYIGAGRYWIAAGALANACLLWIASPQLQFDWLVTQPYAVSLTLAFASLLLVDRVDARRAIAIAAAALMILSHWVNLTVCIVLVPLILARGGARTLRQLSFTAVGVAGGALLKLLSASPRTNTDIVPVTGWPTAWLELLRTTAAGMVHPAGLLVVALLALVAVVTLWRDAPASESVGAAIASVVAACVYWVVVGTFEHVQLNEYYARYIYPSVLLAAVAATLLIAAASRRPRAAAAIACAAFVAGALFVYGVPSIRRVRKDMDRTIGVLTPAIDDAGATVVMGDYWTVWPAVFHANIARYERTGRVGVFGLAFRSEETDRQWIERAKDHPVVIAAPRFEPHLNPLIARTGVPIAFVASRGPLSIYVAGAHRN